MSSKVIIPMHFKDMAMEYYRQSDADLVYEQIKVVDKLLKNHNISYEKHVLKIG